MQKTLRQYHISIVLDKRRLKKNNKYPVKLRLFCKSPKVQKLYPTQFEFSESEFSSIWESQRVKQEYKSIKLELQSLEAYAYEVADSIESFSVKSFEKCFFREIDSQNTINYYYNILINKLYANKQINTAQTYELSLKSLIGFCKSKISNKDVITFIEITPDWLECYESFMLNDLNRSRTTIGMYLRVLKRIFNLAIEEKDISRDIYPFSKNKYQIPSPKGVKKALSKAQLKLLLESTPQIVEQQKAKDFWFLSFLCNGMNIKDIVLLKHENLQSDRIIYYRAKTIKTSKSNLKPIVVFLSEQSQSIINKYKTNTSNTYLFDIITPNDTDIEVHKKVKNFTRFINQHFKKFCQSIGIKEEVSSYWARHSFATTLINNGVSIEFVSEALNHSDLKVTKGYFAGFPDEVKKDIMNNLTNF